METASQFWSSLICSSWYLEMHQFFAQWQNVGTYSQWARNPSARSEPRAIQYLNSCPCSLALFCPFTHMPLWHATSVEQKRECHVFKNDKFIIFKFFIWSKAQDQASQDIKLSKSWDMDQIEKVIARPHSSKDVRAETWREKWVALTAWSSLLIIISFMIIKINLMRILGSWIEPGIKSQGRLIP